MPRHPFVTVLAAALIAACSSSSTSSRNPAEGGNKDSNAARGGANASTNVAGGAAARGGTKASADAAAGAENVATGGVTASGKTTTSAGGSGPGQTETDAPNAPTGLARACADACNAATPVDPKLTDYGALGNVTMYTTEASSGGACLYGATKVMYFAAINVNLVPGDGNGQWQGGSICGQCVEATILTTEGLKSVVVRIMDKCPDGFCGLDLGGAAPETVMVDGMGRYEGAWRFVSCVGHPEVFDGTPSLYIKEGSNDYWAAIQVRNPTMAVNGIDWQKQGDGAANGSLSPATGIENYYLIPSSVLQTSSRFTLTVRYRDGSTATATLTSAELAQPEASYPLS